MSGIGICKVLLLYLITLFISLGLAIKYKINKMFTIIEIVLIFLGGSLLFALIGIIFVKLLRFFRHSGNNGLHVNTMPNQVEEIENGQRYVILCKLKPSRNTYLLDQYFSKS